MLSLEIDVCIPDIFLFMHLDTICSEAHISQMFIAVGMCCLGGGGGGGRLGGGAGGGFTRGGGKNRGRVGGENEGWNLFFFCFLYKLYRMMLF